MLKSKKVVSFNNDFNFSTDEQLLMDKEILFNNDFKYSYFTKSFIYKDINIVKLNHQESSLVELLLDNTQSYHSYFSIQDALSTRCCISIETIRTLVKTIRKKTYPNIITNMSRNGYKINTKDDLLKLKSNDSINILICDDQKTNVEFLNILIKKHLNNIIIHKAIGGKEAIDILKDGNIDIILLDIEMPDISGWDVAKYIKNQLTNQNIAVIFITSVYIDEEFENEGFELGAVDYIKKPLNQNLLINRLNLYIKNFNQETQIFKEIQKRNNKEKELLQKEILLAQSNVLEKIAHHWRQPLSSIAANAGAIEFSLDYDLPKNEIVKSCSSQLSTNIVVQD